MRYQRSTGEMADDFPHRFTADDLAALEAFLLAGETVPLREANLRDATAELVALRHDIDHNLEHALKLARWEHARGIRASYFVLHHAWYWRDDLEPVIAAAHELEHLGHEVGIHSNAVVVARDWAPDDDHERASCILADALAELRWRTITITGAAAHGDTRCETLGVHNNDMFTFAGGPRTLTDFQLDYEAYDLRDRLDAHYISDARGQLSGPLERAAGRQTHALIHPCHWQLS